MNRPLEEFKRIPAEQLRRFGTDCMIAAGMPFDHAEQLATLLTSSSLRGVHSHGIRAISGYSHVVRDRKVNPIPEFEILKETENSIYLGGDGGLGYAPMMQVTEMAIVKAKERGIAAGGTCHIGHYGSAGHYVRRAMEEGCVAFSVQGRYPQWYSDNKGKQVAYYGNPPICFGLPSEEEPPLILDAATCIMADYQRGPEYDALQELIPAAFFKSIGYAGVATVLGGAFTGLNNQRAAEMMEKWPAARHGGMIVVMKLDLFTPAEEVRTGVDDLVREVREEMIPVRGYDEATMPGTVEQRLELENTREGVPIDLKALERLGETGAEFGVEVPWLTTAGD